jgi:hypothetical protein
VGFGLVETRRAQRCAIPGAPEGVPFDRFARCGAVCESKPPTPPLGESEDPSIVGAVGSPTWRHLANEILLDRRWCRSGCDRPEGLSQQNRPGFRASNEPVRRPVRGRHPEGRVPNGFGSNGTRQHEAAMNDKPQLGVGRCTRRSHPEGWGLAVCCLVPRRVQNGRCSRGPKTARTAQTFRATGGVPRGHAARHLLALPKEVVRPRRVRSSEDGRTSAPRGRYG